MIKLIQKAIAWVIGHHKTNNMAVLASTVKLVMQTDEQVGVLHIKMFEDDILLVGNQDDFVSHCRVIHVRKEDRNRINVISEHGTMALVLKSGVIIAILKSPDPLKWETLLKEAQVRYPDLTIAGLGQIDKLGVYHNHVAINMARP